MEELLKRHKKGIETIALTPPKVIIFDWHSTLVDTLEAMYHAVDDTIAEFGGLGLVEKLTPPGESKTDEDISLVNYVRRNNQLHPKIKVERKISRTDIFEVLFGRDEEAKKIAHSIFDNNYRNHFGEIHPFEEGIEQMFIELREKGIKLAVLTNRNREFLRHEIKKIGINGWSHYFETSVCGDEVENRKPAPDPILKALEKMNEQADTSCWYVGDSTTDTVCAKSAGVTNIFYNGARWDGAWLKKIFPGTKKHPHKPDAIVNDFKEFMQLVETSLASAPAKK